ncbi:unnamed protein product [Caretta caretta]
MTSYQFKGEARDRVDEPSQKVRSGVRIGNTRPKVFTSTRKQYFFTYFKYLFHEERIEEETLNKYIETLPYTGTLLKGSLCYALKTYISQKLNWNSSTTDMEKNMAEK